MKWLNCYSCGPLSSPSLRWCWKMILWHPSPECLLSLWMKLTFLLKSKRALLPRVFSCWKPPPSSFSGGAACCHGNPWPKTLRLTQNPAKWILMWLQKVRTKYFSKFGDLLIGNKVFSHSDNCLQNFPFFLENTWQTKWERSRANLVWFANLLKYSYR